MLYLVLPVIDMSTLIALYVLSDLVLRNRASKHTIIPCSIIVQEFAKSIAVSERVNIRGIHIRGG